MTNWFSSHWIDAAQYVMHDLHDAIHGVIQGVIQDQIQGVIHDIM